MERTTDLNLLRKGHSFTWGDIIHLHEIGEYAIIEYHPWKVKSPHVLVGDTNKNSEEFHCYIRGEDCLVSCESLDAALAQCIAEKHEGANTGASSYFMKMIGG